MALRCLIFSSNEEMVKPIRQVLTELGIEGEYCKNAVDAVERVTTQLFQIVITDWEDQPEATFLLKTARDLKAAQRPLTLAIVGDDARPQALQAGANSVLLKPIRAEQVRDTMSTACELLRAKFQPGAPGTPREAPKTAVMAAAASTAGISVPASVTQAPEKIRAGEFLQSSNSAPGAQFDTEKEVHESLEAPVEEVDALTELEPTAAAVQEVPEQKPQPQPEPQEALTGWAALQARLTKSAPRVTEDAPVREDAPARNELPARGEAPSHRAPAATEKLEAPGERQAKAESQSEAALHAYMAGDLKEVTHDPQEVRPKHGKLLVLCALAVVSVALAAVPRTRQELQTLFHSTVRATVRLLNPPDAPLPQAVAQHDSFGQSGDEYKMPAAGNVPDATTDPSQIRVVPVIDPTAKSEKGTGANSGQTQETTGENSPADQPSTGHSATDHSATDQAPKDQSQTVPAQSTQAEASPVADPTVSARNMPGTAKQELPTTAPAAPPVNQNAPAAQFTPPVQDVFPGSATYSFAGRGRWHTFELEIPTSIFDS